MLSEEWAPCCVFLEEANLRPGHFQKLGPKEVENRPTHNGKKVIEPKSRDSELSKNI